MCLLESHDEGSILIPSLDCLDVDSHVIFVLRKLRNEHLVIAHNDDRRPNIFRSTYASSQTPSPNLSAVVTEVLSGHYIPSFHTGILHIKWRQKYDTIRPGSSLGHRTAIQGKGA